MRPCQRHYLDMPVLRMAFASRSHPNLLNLGWPWLSWFVGEDWPPSIFASCAHRRMLTLR
jgi:hypothetical protein